jgi:hypothetical protein
MEDQLSVLDQLQVAYQIVADALREAPQLYECHLDQALLVLVLAMKRARRSPKLRYRRHSGYRAQDLPF